MTPQDLETIRHQFIRYTASFMDVAISISPYVLKQEHTARVCREICRLGKSIGLDDQALLTAECTALLHDIGRFEQYKRYGTFLDRISVNHAKFANEQIDAIGIQHQLKQKQPAMVKLSIAFHNAAELPGNVDDKTLLFVKLLRDADKLDIWRVVADHYTSPEPDASNGVDWGLIDDDCISNDVLAAIHAKTYVRSSLVKRLNDLKLMQISWVFDLNFPCSIARVKAMGYIDRIAATLPSSDDVKVAFKTVDDYLDTHKTKQ